MVRTLDGLGRIVLPIELRRTLGIEIGDPLELFFDDTDERLILRKYRTLGCMFCSSTERLTYFKEHLICSSCLQDVSGNETLSEGEGFNPKVAATLEEVSTEKELGIKQKQTRSKDTLVRLAKVMEQYPVASQKKWAELIGVSQGRVSQLVQKLKDSARASSGTGE